MVNGAGFIDVSVFPWVLLSGLLLFEHEAFKTQMLVNKIKRYVLVMI